AARLILDRLHEQLPDPGPSDVCRDSDALHLGTMARVVRRAARELRHPDDLARAFGDDQHAVVLVEVLHDAPIRPLERLDGGRASAERHSGSVRLGVQSRQRAGDTRLAARDDSRRNVRRYEPPSSADASCTCSSSAASTFDTCWFTIGCSTRWPIDAIGPRMWTSASHLMCVPLPASLRWNAVSMFMIAPTPLPFACSFANSSARSSVFSKSTLIFSPPGPSGTLRFARQCLSSATSKDSTPGIVFARRVGSLSTSHTVSRGAVNSRSPSTFIETPPPRPRATPPDPAAATRRGDRDCSCRSRS